MAKDDDDVQEAGGGPTPTPLSRLPQSSDAPGPYGGGYEAPEYPWRSQSDSVSAPADVALATGDIPPPNVESVMGGYESARAGAADIKLEEAQTSARTNEFYIERLKRDANEQRVAASRQEIAAGSLPRPWNADKEMQDRFSSPLERFGSMATIFGFIASGFSKQPLTSALNAGAAAMNAIGQSEERGYQKAYTAWKDNTQLAVDRFNIEHQLFNDTTHLFNTDLNVWKAQSTANAAKFDDKRALNLLNNGMYPEYFEMMDKRAKAVSGMQEALRGQEIWNAEHEELGQYWDKMRKEHGAQAPQEQKWNEYQVKHALALRMAELHAKDTPARIVASGMREHFEKTGKEMSAEKQAELYERARAYGTRGAGGVAGAQLRRQIEDEGGAFSRWQEVTGREPNAEERKLIRDVYQTKGGQAAKMVGQLGAAMDAIGNRNEEGKPMAPEEATKTLREAATLKPQLTGGQKDKLLAQVKRYDVANDTIDKVEKLLVKHNAMTGLGGTITRPLEVVSNWFGSDKTDRAQFKSYIEELRLWSTSLMNEAQYRPLSAQETRITSIVRGLNPGDTTINTAKGLLELQKLFKDLRETTRKRSEQEYKPEPLESGGEKAAPGGNWWARDKAVQ